jgi:putative flippase GtrA
VDFAQVVLAKWRLLRGELTKFGLIGVVNTGVDLVVWNLFLFLGPIKAKVISTVIAATLSYFMNRHWTFRHRERSGVRREYTLFFALNGVGLVIMTGVIGVAKYGMGIHGVIGLNIANLVAIVVATLFRFWSYRRWVFRAEPGDAVPASAPEPVTNGV